MSQSEAAPFSVLRHRSVLLLWLSRGGSSFAAQMQAVAVGWQLYDLTSNPFDLGVVGLVQVIPAIALSIFAGQAADRYDRRAVLKYGQMVEALSGALLAAATLTDTISAPIIFTCMFLLGAARPFEITNLQAIAPAIVPPALLSSTVAALASAQQTATIAGPALGGVLYLLGPSVVYVVASALFLIAALCAGAVHMERRPPSREPVTMETLFAGFRFILRNQLIIGALVIDLFAVLVGSVTILLPVFARDVFAVGPWGLGLLRAAPAVGALTTSLFLARKPLNKNLGPTIFSMISIYAIATIVFGVSTNFAVSIVALFAIGASDLVSVVIRHTLLQSQTPDEMRGRVSAVNALFTATSNQLGDFRAGSMATLMGVQAAVILGGAATLTVVLASIKVFPALFRMDTNDWTRK